MWNILLHVYSIMFLPLVFVFGLIRGGKTRWAWWSALLVTLSVTLWAFVIGRWDMAGYWFRFLLPLLFVVALIAGRRRMSRQGRAVPRGTALNLTVGVNLAVAVVFSVLSALGLAGLAANEPAVHLEFPLREGIYYVGQGGSTVMVNYHAAYSPQRYALDIVRLNSWGYRASGLYPAELDRYVIFGDPLYSPCTGEVVAARDGLPDHEPPLHDPERAEGNYVTIRCAGVDVVMAHLREGTLRVRQGDVVAVGQLIGEVGNSGNTSEPHLHIHAERLIERPDGGVERVGVPIRFDGKFLARNTIVRSR